MSRLTEYMPDLTGVVFEDDDGWEEKMKQALGGGKTPTGGTTTATAPATKGYYEQRREDDLKEYGFKTLAQLAADPSAKWMGSTLIRLGDFTQYTRQAGTDIWKQSSPAFHNKTENSAYENAKPVSSGAPGAAGGGTTPGTTPGVLPGVRGDVSPEARQFGPVSSTSLPNAAGVSIPGWDAYRQPGIGIPDVLGRQQLTDRTGLNSMRAGSQGSATQFPVAPGFRGAGQTGNNINFAGTGDTRGNTQLASTLEPNMTFAPATANVPDTYVQGQGNVGPMGGIMPLSLPFNIGPGGAALANVAGNNVQVNGPPGGVNGVSTGYGTVLNAMPASNVFDLTGRNAAEDPALQTIQMLQLQSAIAQGLQGSLYGRDAANPNQFGGNRAGTANGPFSGNGGSYGQGQYWAGYTPDPLGATPPATPGAGTDVAPAAPTGAFSEPNMPQTSEQLGTAGRSLASNFGANSPYAGLVPSGAVDRALAAFGAGGGSTNPVGGTAAASLLGRNGAGYMGSTGGPPAPSPGGGRGNSAPVNPMLSNVQQSLAPAPPAAGLPPPGGAPPAISPAVLAAVLGQRDEEDRGGPGYGPDGGQRGFSMGGRVNSSLPGFATGAKVVANPTVAAPAIDASLTGDLSTPAGAGGAVETKSPTTSINPAANAIQPVQGPQSTTAIVPAPGAATAGGAPAQTPVPAYQAQPQPGLDLGVLSRFNESVAKQAQQQQLRNTYSNRWEAANLKPTAVQLQPGQEMPTEGLPPSMYYDISEALQSLMGDIRGSQTELAGLGNIGTPEQIMAYLSGLEVEQAPYQKAQDIKLQLAGLGAGGQGDTAGLMQQQEALKQQMGPLGTILGAQEKRTALGDRLNMEGLGAQVVSLENAIQGAQAQSKRAGELQTKQRQQGLNHAEALELYNMVNLGDPAEMEVRLFNLKHQLSQAEGQNNAIDEAERTITNLLAQAGLTPDQAASQLGLYGAQMDQLKQAYNAAMQGETYRQQMASLIGDKDPTAELGRLGALIGQTKTDYGNVEKARLLNNRITNLAARGAQLPGFDRGGDVTTDDHDDQNMTTGVDLGPYSPSQGYGAGGPLAADVNEAAKGRWQDEYAGPLANVIGELNLPFGTNAFLAGPMSNRVGEGIYNQELDRLRTENEAGRYLPGMRDNTGYGRVANFAKGGNWIAGATSNSHGQFRAKAKSAGMSTKAYASKMSDAPGRTGKQARLAKTLMGFADGGDMTTNEPIIGIGMFTGRPRFQVGEPQYPGGPPMAERLSIEPLNRPAALPMGRMRSAA